MAGRHPQDGGGTELSVVQDLLDGRHPGVRVASVEVVDAHELTNAHARLRVTYDEAAGAPEHLFCKVPPTDPARRQTINATGMGRREASFYDSLAGALRLRTPAVHGVSLDEESGEFVLLLEDLVSSGCTVSDGTVGVTPDAAAVALEELAELHVRYGDAARRAAEAPWVQPAGSGSDYAVEMLRFGLAHHRDELTPAFCAVAERYIADRHSLQALWHSGPQTVVHGDAHLGNVFDDHGRTGFLDWGMVMVSNPMRDVSYFLTMAMDVDARRAHEADLLRHYLDARGDDVLSFDAAWLTHRQTAAYCVPASCQVVLFPEDATPARKVFAQAFLDRAMAAVEDLGALDAVNGP